MIIYGLLGMEKKANKTKAFIIIFTCSDQLPFPEQLQHGGTGSETQSHVSHKISKLKKHIQLDFWGEPVFPMLQSSGVSLQVFKCQSSNWTSLCDIQIK